jgi:hypothetical protein
MTLAQTQATVHRRDVLLGEVSAGGLPPAQRGKVSIKPQCTRRPDVTAEEKKLFYAACDAFRAEEPRLSVRGYAYRMGGLMNIYLHGDLCTKAATEPQPRTRSKSRCQCKGTSRREH